MGDTSGQDPLTFAREAVTSHRPHLQIIDRYQRQIATFKTQIAQLQERCDGLEDARSTQQQKLDSQADGYYKQLSQLAAIADTDQLQVLEALVYLWGNLENHDLAGLQAQIDGTRKLLTWPAATPVVVWEVVRCGGWFGQRLAHQPRLIWSQDQWRVRIQLQAPPRETPVMTVLRIDELAKPGILERHQIYIGHQAIEALLHTSRSSVGYPNLLAAAQAVGIGE